MELQQLSNKSGRQRKYFHNHKIKQMENKTESNVQRFDMFVKDLTDGNAVSDTSVIGQSNSQDKENGENEKNSFNYHNTTYGDGDNSKNSNKKKKKFYYQRPNATKKTDNSANVSKVEEVPVEVTPTRKSAKKKKNAVKRCSKSSLSNSSAFDASKLQTTTPIANPQPQRRSFSEVNLKTEGKMEHSLLNNQEGETLASLKENATGTSCLVKQESTELFTYEAGESFHDNSKTVDNTADTYRVIDVENDHHETDLNASPLSVMSPSHTNEFNSENCWITMYSVDEYAVCGEVPHKEEHNWEKEVLKNSCSSVQISSNNYILVKDNATTRTIVDSEEYVSSIEPSNSSRDTDRKSAKHDEYLTAKVLPSNLFTVPENEDVLLSPIEACPSPNVDYQSLVVISFQETNPMRIKRSDISFCSSNDSRRIDHSPNSMCSVNSRTDFMLGESFTTTSTVSQEYSTPFSNVMTEALQQGLVLGNITGRIERHGHIMYVIQVQVIITRLLKSI